MYNLEPDFKGTAQFPMPVQSLFGSTQTSLVSPSRIISVPISPRSSRSDQIVYRPFGSARYQLPVNTFGSWPVYSDCMNSPMTKNSRIFSNEKRDQILQKYKSPVTKNMKIINYGPIQIYSAQPTLRQSPKSIKRSQSPINVTFKQRQTKSRMASQPKINPYQSSTLQNRRYHDHTNSLERSITQQETRKTMNDISQNMTYNMTLNNTTFVENNANTSASNKFINLVQENMIPQPRLKKFITFSPLNTSEKQQKKEDIKNKNLWVWAACLVCCLILIGLLVAM